MLVKEVMVKDVFVARPGDSILDVANIMMIHGIEGMPVVNKDKFLLGVITQASLISEDTGVHVPTLLKIFDTLDLYKRDRKLIKDRLKELNSLLVEDAMNKQPPVIHEHESVEDAIKQLSRTHDVKPTSVINSRRELVGVITQHDLVGSMAGSYNEKAREKASSEKVDKKVRSFLRSFNKRFIFISRWRSRMWLWLNLGFMFVGIAIALFSILRVTVG